MISNKILEAYETMAQSYHEKIDTKPHNAFYDRPNTLSLFDELKGKKILDAACGPGKYAEELIALGANVTGFDFSEKMVGFAKERIGNKGSFFVHNLEQPLGMFAENHFDYVLCALALHYIEDWNYTFSEFSRVLKPGGKLIISIEHPFFEYLFHKAENYFKKEAVSCIWSGFGSKVRVFNYRRSLQDCLDPFVDNNFLIKKILEPRPLKEFETFDARHFRELNNFPAFMCIKGISIK